MAEALRPLRARDGPLDQDALERPFEELEVVDTLAPAISSPTDAAALADE